MLLIHCPFCGDRDEHEFVCGGQSHISRPSYDVATDAEWAEYLFSRDNPKGVHLERWLHLYGCRQWFNIARDTRNHSIAASYRMLDPIPEFD